MTKTKIQRRRNANDEMWTHAHEHLGQAIAYARMVGVVPPWTVAAEKKAPGAEGLGGLEPLVVLWV
jgi:hypothetical protein